LRHDQRSIRFGGRGAYCWRYADFWRSWLNWVPLVYRMVSLYETISYWPFRTVDQTVNASPDFHPSEDELSVGSGNALRSIEWYDGNLKIEHLNTVPLTSIWWHAR
jgi:hypothetical protein